LNDLDISQVARRSGVPASTLRYYEEKGLVTSVGREAGFSLAEIDRMFAPDGRPQINRQALAAKADELDRTIAKLQAMRTGLRHAAVCSAPSHLQCPTFRRLLGIAASRGRRRG
jgi:DNA-binding transcriptional MerR regulator